MYLLLCNKTSPLLEINGLLLLLHEGNIDTPVIYSRKDVVAHCSVILWLKPISQSADFLNCWGMNNQTIPQGEDDRQDLHTIFYDNDQQIECIHTKSGFFVCQLLLKHSLKLFKTITTLNMECLYFIIIKINEY